MTSFTSLLQSIGGPKLDQSPATTPKPASNVLKSPNSGLSTAPKPVTPTNEAARLAPNNAAAGVKRKSEDQSTAAPQAKVVRTEVKVPVRPVGQTGGSVKPALPSPSTTAPYRGTARASAPSSTTRPTQSSINKPALPVSSTPAGPANAAVPKPKRGFSSILEKAKAAQEAAKAAGINTIKHKPVEKMTKRERLKMQDEAKQRTANKGRKAGLHDHIRSGTPTDGKLAMQQKASEPSYKGTMKKAVVQPEVTYKGTMKRAAPGTSSSKLAAKKGMGQDKYGGYASWSDLSAAEEEEEEEEEEDYDSEGSEDMDAGFDDMQREETMALKAARKEDQEALEEEERLKREKLERKRKLQALSKTAAARKKF